MPPCVPVSAADLLASLRELRCPIDTPIRSDESASDLADRLVTAGHLTRFQADTLLAGEGERLVLRQYWLLDRIGNGGMGQVYRARHRALDRIDALKVIRPDLLGDAAAVERFRREARAAARLSHPHLVTVFDADDAGGRHYLAMEYVAGPDLAALVRDRGPLPVGPACDLIRQAALGLHHAHERSLVHRDVKPSNLLLAGGRVKVVDLGLARFAADGGQTETGAFLGTPDFVSPEQASDARSADSRADVYSLGGTLYYLLSGRPPFAGGSAVEKLLRHRTEPPPRLPHLPDGLAIVIDRMLAKSPADRPHTAAEVAELLRSFADPAAGDVESVSDRADTTGWAPSGLSGMAPTQPPPRRPRRIGRWWAALAIGLVVVGGATFGWLNWLAPRSEQPSVPTTQPAGPQEPTRWVVGQRLHLGDYGVYGLAFDGGGQFLAVGCGEASSPQRAGYVFLYDVASRKERRLGELKAHVACVAVSHDGRDVAAGCGHPTDAVRGQVVVWDAKGGDVLADFVPHKTGVSAVLLFGDELFTAGRDGVLGVWRLDPPKAPSKVCSYGEPGGSPVTGLARSAGGLLATGDESGHIRLWPAGGRPEFDVARGVVRDLTFTPDGATLVGVVDAGRSGASEVRGWDVATGRTAFTLTAEGQGATDPFHALALSRDGRTLAATFETRINPDGSGQGLIQLWDVTWRRRLGQLQNQDEQSAHWRRANCLAFSPAGGLLASGGDDTNLILWQPEK